GLPKRQDVLVHFRERHGVWRRPRGGFGRFRLNGLRTVGRRFALVRHVRTLCVRRLKSGVRFVIAGPRSACRSVLDLNRTVRNPTKPNGPGFGGGGSASPLSDPAGNGDRRTARLGPGRPRTARTSLEG